MLCPDIWNYPVPENTIEYNGGNLNNKSLKNLNKFISKHYFNEIFSIVLPGEYALPGAVSDLIKDSDHYKVHDFQLKELLSRQFIEGFVRRGKFTALSCNVRHEIDDCFAVSPDGLLILSVSREVYQSLGVEGHPIKNSRRHKDKYSDAMPKIKQPKSLEELSLKALVQWLCNIGRSLLPVIVKISRNNALRASEILKLRISFIQKVFEYNVPCYLFDRLSMQIFTTIPAILDKAKKETSTTATMSAFLLNVNVFVSLSEVILSPYLKRLNFEEMPKMMRHLFYAKLKLLSGLNYLNLSSLSGGWKTSDMEPIVLNGVVNMRNLHTFVLNYDATDNILQVLEKSCPRLQVLDISSSKLISNNSIKHLLEMHHLRSVQLYRTSVTLEGYIRLLIKLPLLEDVGRFDEIGRCLEYIDMTYENFESYERPTLMLKIFSSRYVVTKHLQLLAEWCPEIKAVSIFHNPLLNDLMALISINKLSELRLLSCDFFGDQVRDVLQVKGCNITYLHLEHVDQIDMNALMYISQYCPDLKNFTIYNCELIESTSLYTKTLEIPPFMNLERLTIAANCRHQHLEFLLSNCFKIKFIHIGTMAPTSDDLINRILAKNPMQHLEELRIIYSDGLTIASAYKIVDICQNLCILNELESWTLIKELELECFKLYLSARNFDLDIKPLRRFNKAEEESV